MFRNLRTMSLASSAAAVLFLLSSTVALAQKTVTVLSGHTRVTFASGFSSALEASGIQTRSISPTALEHGVADFLITGGAVDLDTGSGQALHAGGLTLTQGTTEIRLQSLIVDTTVNPGLQISGLVVVNGTMVGRVPLFYIILPPGFTLPLTTDDEVLRIRPLGLVLSGQAASALNGAFHTALPAGMPVGSAGVVAVVPSACDNDDHDGDCDREGER